MSVRDIRALAKISGLIILVGKMVDVVRISGKVFSPVLSALFLGISKMKKFSTRMFRERLVPGG